MNSTKSNGFWDEEPQPSKNIASSGFSKPNLSLSSKPQIQSKGFSVQDNNKKSGGNGFWDEVDDADKFDYQQTDLNKLSKTEIDKHKQKMDLVFNKNQKKPDDPDFVYDKQEDFEPHEDNDWDEDLELDM